MISRVNGESSSLPHASSGLRMNRYQSIIITDEVEQEFISMKIQKQHCLSSRAFMYGKEVVRAAQSNSQESPFINLKRIKLD